VRPSQRQPSQLRPVRITRRFTCHAEGSVLIEVGDTRVLCTASVEDVLPAFLRGKGQGWVTAEYGMLPRATHTRSGREATKGKQSGRTQEIQRLIGRGGVGGFQVRSRPFLLTLLPGEDAQAEMQRGGVGSLGQCLGYDLTRSVGLQAELERFAPIDRWGPREGESDQFTLGVRWRF